MVDLLRAGSFVKVGAQGRPGPMQLGLDGPRCHSSRRGDVGDGHVEQVVEDDNLSLALRESFESGSDRSVSQRGLPRGRSGQHPR